MSDDFWDSVIITKDPISKTVETSFVAAGGGSLDYEAPDDAYIEPQIPDGCCAWYAAGGRIDPVFEYSPLLDPPITSSDLLAQSPFSVNVRLYVNDPSRETEFINISWTDAGGQKAAAIPVDHATGYASGIVQVEISYDFAVMFTSGYAKEGVYDIATLHIDGPLTQCLTQQFGRVGKVGVGCASGVVDVVTIGDFPVHMSLNKCAPPEFSASECSGVDCGIFDAAANNYFTATERTPPVGLLYEFTATTDPVSRFDNVEKRVKGWMGMNVHNIYASCASNTDHNWVSVEREDPCSGFSLLHAHSNLAGANGTLYFDNRSNSFFGPLGGTEVWGDFYSLPPDATKSKIITYHAGAGVKYYNKTGGYVEFCKKANFELAKTGLSVVFSNQDDTVTESLAGEAAFGLEIDSGSKTVTLTNKDGAAVSTPTSRKLVDQVMTIRIVEEYSSSAAGSQGSASLRVSLSVSGYDWALQSEHVITLNSSFAKVCKPAYIDDSNAFTRHRLISSQTEEAIITGVMIDQFPIDFDLLIRLNSSFGNYQMPGYCCAYSYPPRKPCCYYNSWRLLTGEIPTIAFISTKGPAIGEMAKTIDDFELEWQAESGVVGLPIAIRPWVYGCDCVNFVRVTDLVLVDTGADPWPVLPASNPGAGATSYGLYKQFASARFWPYGVDWEVAPAGKHSIELTALKDLKVYTSEGPDPLALMDGLLLTLDADENRLTITSTLLSDDPIDVPLPDGYRLDMIFEIELTAGLTKEVLYNDGIRYPLLPVGPVERACTKADVEILMGGEPIFSVSELVYRPTGVVVEWFGQEGFVSGSELPKVNLNGYAIAAGMAQVSVGEDEAFYNNFWMDYYGLR